MDTTIREDYKPSEFGKEEMKRLVSLIPTTDPTTMNYSQLLENLERLTYSFPLIDYAIGIAESADGKVLDVKLSENPSKEEQKEEPVPDSPMVDEDENPFENKEEVAVEETAEEPEKKYTFEEVKFALIQARNDKGLQINQWLGKNFAVKKFSDIPEDTYPAVMKLLSQYEGEQDA